jgi:hypothetical protein
MGLLDEPVMPLLKAVGRQAGSMGAHVESFLGEPVAGLSVVACHNAQTRT